MFVCYILLYTVMLQHYYLSCYCYALLCFFFFFNITILLFFVYFLCCKDEFYVIETLYAVGDDKIDLKLSKKKVLETNDNEFIGKVIEDVKSYYCVKSNKDLNKIIEGGSND